ncbi:uncharacterized protein ALTATR162_LOCUS8609 [Alternaria atra]|uniref:Uncharacterized protein n=1 Tax=Alternaria atra TaxID=119953 RepID=A0A8J2ICX5_9PLEO|nr:uncharacterized protein ALTATR162_LOCUS8609 [Alternaria atra]CAG5178255.1 unnamed protein product [Alternaria atra]
MPAAVPRDPNNHEHHPVFAEDDPPSSAQERADDYKILLRAPEGSFQPDLPTAESGDLQRDGFQFGFNEGASKRVKHDSIDDDDQPPQLNHDPPPASSQLDLQQRFIYINKDMDVSDEDSDRDPVRGRGLAPLPTSDTKQKADSISPVLPPVGTSAGVASNKNDSAVGVKHDEEMCGAGIIRYEDTPFVLIRQQPDDVVTTERSSTDTISALVSRENPQESAKHSSFEPEDRPSPYGNSPIPSQRRANELPSAERQIGYGNRASYVESPTLGLLDSTFRTGKVRRIASFEAEVVTTRDATPTSDASFDVKDEQMTSKVEKADAERAFSPVWFAKNGLQLPNTNTRSLGDADERAQVRATTFAQERDENARSLPNPSSEAIGEIAAPAQQQIWGHGVTSLSDTLAGANAAAADSDTSTRRVSTPPSQGVDAVEEHSASASVDISWDHRYPTTEPRVVTGDSDKMRDERDCVTPVAQVPRITQNSTETPKAEELHNENSHPAMSNGYFHGQANFPDFKHQAQQLQVSNNTTIAPERSRSMLSQISAMVSDDGNNPYSQTSTGRSTPSTIRRMQPDSTMKPSAAPPQIPEEVLTSYGGDDDFDLYADHNGIVKDVQDTSGRPLRLADLQVPGATPQSQPSRPSTSDTGTAPAARDGDRPRYSFERPMSFISGPEDQDGKPQDQINQAASSNAMQVPPIPEQHRYQPQQSRQTETVYSMNPPASMIPPSDHIASRYQPMPASGPSPSKNIFQAVKSIDPSNKMTQATIGSWRPSGEPVSQQVLSENPNVSHQPPQTSQPPDRVLHEPQGRQMVLGQSVPQSNLDRPQEQTEYHEAQTHTQANGPRNQFELHQQMVQRQAQYPQEHDAEFRPPATSSHSSAEQTPRQQAKPSSKPRLSSMFKSLGGKAQPNPQLPSSAGNTVIHSDSKPLPPNPNYGGPVQSVRDRFTRSREASAERLVEQPRSFVPPNRPSMGQRPQFIQTPLTTPSTGSNSDPREPIISASPNGFPSQQPPSMPNTQVQPHQVPQSGTPEKGKKKRFSAFGALFNRGASGDGSATKYKLSKEGKRAQKTQQNTAVPIAQPLASQWVPQQQPYKPQQSGLAYYPPGQLPPHTVQNGPPMGLKLGPSQPAPNMHLQGPPQQYQQAQQGPPQRKSISSTRPEEGSAFLKTKQLAMEHQARQSSLQSHQAHNPNPGTVAQSSSTSSENDPSHMRDPSSGPPPGGYYNPHTEQASVERGAYAVSLAARQEAEQRRHQETPQQGSYVVPQTDRQHDRQQSGHGQNVYRDTQYAQHGPSSRQIAHQAWLAQREQHAYGHDRSWPNDDARVQQLRQQQQGQNMESWQSDDTRPVPYHNASDPRPHHPSQDAVPITPPAVSPMQEPRYEAPPIPAAYHPVSGAFISPIDRQQRPLLGQFDRRDSEPRMQAVSPQISAQSLAPHNGRSHSDASTMSLVSPISNSPALPNSSPAPGAQRYQKPRMSSISEVHQQDRPWHLSFPEGATEQEIVRARQGQYMQERFTAQQQQQAERAAGSPSPCASPEQTTPTTTPPHAQAQGGGFRELLPRSSSQPYTDLQVAQSSHDLQPIVRRDATPVQPTPIHPGQSPPPAAYPLPMSPDPMVLSSPVNPTASGLPPPPPPKVAHSPVRPGFGSTQPFSFEEQRQHFHNPSPRGDGYTSQPRTAPQYDEQVPDEAPPLYDGPGVPNDGMNKSRPEALRPPNIMTDTDYESRGRQSGSRPRQPSIGILQHPQPASMAASPQRTSPDMGAESLRRQLLQQENLAHMERVQREQEQRERQERDRQEREAARARARELERSASGGGQVPSLRSVGGSTTGGPPGWERRGSHSRPVFELPAVDDDEPTMKATSYPGQEWVPPMWDGD